MDRSVNYDLVRNENADPTDISFWLPVQIEDETEELSISEVFNNEPKENVFLLPVKIQSSNNNLSLSKILEKRSDDPLSDVTFLIPAHNEEKAIGRLVEQIKLWCSSRVIVVDNDSTDKTAEVGRKHGAYVFPEKHRGKAHAVKKGFHNVKSKFAIMLDADFSYDPRDAEKLLQPLINDEADVVMGSRIHGKRDDGALPFLNLIANHVFSTTATLLYGRVSDVCTGYWAFKREVLQSLLKMGIDSTGFEIEAEMYAKLSQMGFRIVEVPIKYRQRVGTSKLNRTKDAIKIIRTFIAYKLLSHKP